MRLGALVWLLWYQVCDNWVSCLLLLWAVLMRVDYRLIKCNGPVSLCDVKKLFCGGWVFTIVILCIISLHITDALQGQILRNLNWLIFRFSVF